MEIALSDLAPIRDLYNRGLYLQAFEATKGLGPIRSWSNVPARLLGGRLAVQLGAPKLGRRLHLAAYRSNPSHPEAIYYHARFRLERYGPMNAWQFMRAQVDWDHAPPEVRGDWYGLLAFVQARFRDFDKADKFLAQAEKLNADRAWLYIERAAVQEFAEKYDDALESANRSIEMQPNFRPGLQASTHLMQIVGREREAADRLAAATAQTECGMLVAQLAALYVDLRQWDDAARQYDRYADLSPLMEADVAQWLAAHRADVAYFRGDLDTARELCPQAIVKKEPFYKGFEERLAKRVAEDPTPLYRRLDAESSAFPLHLSADSPEANYFAAIARYWGKSCPNPETEGGVFDGLPDVKERDHAVKQGFETVEFRIDPASLKATVIDRGWPLLVTFVDTGYSHPFAVVGYDAVRETVWLYDPTDHRINESPVATLVERYAPFGPVCLAIVPPEQAGDLAILQDTLADSSMYEALYRVQAALLLHERDKAVIALDHMKKGFPEATLTLFGELALARYDANPVRIERINGRILERHPNEIATLLSQMNALRDLGHKEDRTALAQAQVERAEAEPLFAQHFAQLVITDPDRQGEAIFHLEHTIRKRSHSAGAYYILGNLYWEQKRFQEAIEVYRFAAALDDRDEQFAEAYYRAASMQGQTPEAMRFLQNRYQRTRGKLVGPTRALFYALCEQAEMDSAFAILENVCEPVVDDGSEATRDTPNSRLVRGELLLFLAEMRASFDDTAEAQLRLEQAKELVPEMTWLRVAARVATIAIDLPKVRELQERMLELEPLAADVQRQMARTLADLEGRIAALARVERYLEKYPHHYLLAQLMIDWYRSEPTTPAGQTVCRAEPLLRRMLNETPEDAWAHRELALHLANANQFDAAFEQMEIAKKLDTQSPSYYYTLGHLCARADRTQEAKDAYESALDISLDNEVAINELFNLARGEEERKETAQTIAEKFAVQRHFTDSLITFRDQTVSIFEPDDLYRILNDALDEHPDIWQAWSTTIQQLILCMRHDEAKNLAKDAVARFPLLSRLWADLAEAYEALNDNEGQIDALKQALKASPTWGYASRELSEALEAIEQREEGRAVLEQAIGRAPTDAVNHGYLADLLWNMGEGDEAIERVRQALKIDPGYEWAWRSLDEWTTRTEMPQMALRSAREVCDLRPGDPRAWLALARMLGGTEGNEEALAALDRVIALNPRIVEAYDIKAEKLTELGRFAEALSAAKPENHLELFGPEMPMILQGRLAWVKARSGALDEAIKEMNALLSIEPGYYWGRQQLAEWYNDTNNSEAYLEAADRLIEMRADSPRAWAMRGDAKLQTGDRDGGKSDLREALKMSPDYPYPGLLLFDAHLQDDETKEARSVLALMQEHVGEGARHLVGVRRVQLATRTEDLESAMRALDEIASLPVDSSWALVTAMNEIRAAGWGEEGDEVLRKSWDKEVFHPWTLLIWLEGSEGQKSTPEERVALLERVLESHPRFVQGYDTLAEILTRMKRYDEAKEACRPAPFGETPPLLLLGRSAWVTATSGDRDAAISQMKQIVMVDPDYYWGWQQLASWYDSNDDHPSYLEAAENMVRIRPYEPVAFGFRGDARYYLGDRRGAKGDFAKAYELDPNYIFAGLRLFDEQLEDNEIDAVGRTLMRMQEHSDAPDIRYAAIRLAVKKGDRDEARTQFRDLCLEPGTNPWLCGKSAELMGKAGWNDEVAAALEEAIEDEDAIPVVGRLWAENAMTRGDGRFEDRIPELVERGRIGVEALLATIDGMAVPSQVDRLMELVERYETLLRSESRAWARTADALTRVEQYHFITAWMNDWKDRELSDAWMLYPLALSLRKLGREEAAIPVSEAALQLADDLSTPRHQTWLGFEAAVAGNAEAALDYFGAVDPDELDDTFKILGLLGEALAKLERAEPSERKRVFGELKKLVQSSLQTIGPKVPDGELKRAYRRWVSKVVAAAGGVGAKFWGVTQRLSPWL